ncbi:unnamed protein product [Vicia faba]|uniref:Uncharacterized protein n=1 Tax=Vicia faba TaxID=3906 RepID=A0AAV0ZXS2_VICFA|nr:unnamed protein product [Vicia faba]
MYFWFCTFVQKIIEPYCNIGFGFGLRGAYLFVRCCLSLDANPSMFFICFLTELILGLKDLCLLYLFVCLFYCLLLGYSSMLQWTVSIEQEKTYQQYTYIMLSTYYLLSNLILYVMMMIIKLSHFYEIQ